MAQGEVGMGVGGVEGTESWYSYLSSLMRLGIQEMQFKTNATAK